MNSMVCELLDSSAERSELAAAESSRRETFNMRNSSFRTKASGKGMPRHTLTYFRTISLVLLLIHRISSLAVGTPPRRA